MKMLTDHDGKMSSMRVMSFMSLFASFGAGYFTIMQDSSGNGVYITSAFLLGAFCPKALQAFFERAYTPKGK